MPDSPSRDTWMLAVVARRGGRRLVSGRVDPISFMFRCTYLVRGHRKSDSSSGIDSPVALITTARRVMLLTPSPECPHAQASRNAPCCRDLKVDAGFLRPSIGHHNPSAFGNSWRHDDRDGYAAVAVGGVGSKFTSCNSGRMTDELGGRRWAWYWFFHQGNGQVSIGFGGGSFVGDRDQGRGG